MSSRQAPAQATPTTPGSATTNLARTGMDPRLPISGGLLIVAGAILLALSGRQRRLGELLIPAAETTTRAAA